MKNIRAVTATALLLLLALPARTVCAAPDVRTPTPGPGATPKAAPKAGTVGVVSSGGTVTAPPAGSHPAAIQDVRHLDNVKQDPVQLERYGLAAYQAKEYAMARSYFAASWKAGVLPTAAYNLACLDAIEGHGDAAFKNLELAVGAGFDDDRTLSAEKDFESIRSDARFGGVVAEVRKNRVNGDLAVVKDGMFVAPDGTAAGILVVLHDSSSDPLSASGPFVEAARKRHLFLAAPRGPSAAGNRRFEWSSTDRALAAIDAAIAEARKRAGSATLPLFAAGVGRGGTLALAAASKKARLFAGVATFGGPFDAGSTGAAEAARTAQSLRGTRVFMGIPRDAPPALRDAFRSGRDAMKRFGVAVAYQEFPGTGTALPKKPAVAADAALESIAGPAAPSRPAPAAAKR